MSAVAKLFKTRLTWIWLLLVILTCVSWETVQEVAWIQERHVGGVLVILIAFFKVRLIVLDFMEVRHAPIALRIAAETWIVLCCAGVVGMFRWGAPFLK